MTPQQPCRVRGEARTAESGANSHLPSDNVGESGRDKKSSHQTDFEASS